MAKIYLIPTPKNPLRVYHPEVVNTLVVGATGSGKSFLVKHLVEIEMRQERRGLLVFDPKQDPTWPRPTLNTSDQDEYTQAYWGSEEFICAHDECREVIGLHNTGFVSFATRGRRQRHHNWFITQQVRGLSPALIGECTELYAFRCGPKNAADLVEDFIHPELANCPHLRQYEFLHLLAWGPDGDRFIEKGRLQI